MDRLFVHMRQKYSTSGEHLPEFRIPLSFPGAALAAVGLVIYGWSATFHVHWAVVDFGICVAMLGMQIAGMPLQAYVMDRIP